jgi:uncharacterized membrane protein YdjX (TVP38/TMEM64 family)
MRPFERPNRPRALSIQTDSAVTTSSTPTPPPPLPHIPPPSPFLSHFHAWFHFPNHPHPARTPSDLSLLPLSAATSEFEVDIQNAKHFPFTLSPNHIPILTVILLLPLTTMVVYFALHSLPISLAWPRTITDLAQLGTELRGYSQSSALAMAHVIAVMSVSAIWKHAWSIPGSVVWNVLAGALFPPVLAVVLLSFLTMVGSAAASLLSAPLAPILSHFFPRALDMTRAALQGSSDKPESVKSAWIRLSVLRLIGVVPWSGINIACGVSGVPLYDCMLGAFIGTLPWTAVTCQIGDILQTVASHPTSPTSDTVSSLLASPAIITKLVLLSVLSLAPILAKDRLKALIGHDEIDPTIAAATAVARERPGRRSWVQEWRDKIRVSSRSRTRRLDETQLSELVREKRAMQDS